MGDDTGPDALEWLLAKRAQTFSLYEARLDDEARRAGRGPRFEWLNYCDAELAAGRTPMRWLDWVLTRPVDDVERAKYRPR